MLNLKVCFPLQILQFSSVLFPRKQRVYKKDNFYLKQWDLSIFKISENFLYVIFLSYTIREIRQNTLFAIDDYYTCKHVCSTNVRTYVCVCMYVYMNRDRAWCMMHFLDVMGIFSVWLIFLWACVCIYTCYTFSNNHIDFFFFQHTCSFLCSAIVNLVNKKQHAICC